ncbi:MAG: phosphate signaling complex protein PhoU, partial [Pseudonocardiaceae bacterium]
VKATQRHFDQELNDLRELLLRMAGRAEEQMRSGLTAVKRLDAQAAQQTILTDRDVDALELEIEEQAINLLARRQPMAGDLRTLVAVLKISNDLERVGDHAVNIAQCAKRLAEAFPMPQPSELDQMAELATGMLRDAITAFIERDVALARNVCMRDEEVDRYNDTVFRLMLSRMAENTSTVIPALQMMLVARNLERVADLATNLAEDVIYIVEARTIKHHATEIEGEFDQ